MTPKQLIAQRLQAIREQAEKATKGPWRYEITDGARHIRTPDGSSLQSDEAYYPWCSENEADWLFQASARSTVPRLVEVVEFVLAEFEQTPCSCPFAWHEKYQEASCPKTRANRALACMADLLARPVGGDTE